MSIEIKFKVFHAITKAIIGYEQFSSEFGWTHTLVDEDEYTPIVRDGTIIDGIDRGIRVRYTGLKDRNGVEIYEGDVIAMFFDSEVIDGKLRKERNYHVAEIRYCNGGFCAMEKGDKEDEIDILLGHLIDDSEVIGNIYENPELL